MNKVMDNGVIRDATPEEIAVWEEIYSQPAPPPGPQEQVMTLARAMAAPPTGLTDALPPSIPAQFLFNSSLPVSAFFPLFFAARFQKGFA